MTSSTMDRRLGLVGNTAIKAPVDVATTANITLSGEQTIDGVLTSSSRVLVKDQSTTTQNGIYDSSSGAWTRSLDFNGNYDITKGTLVGISGGTQAGVFYKVDTANPITVGTSAITFSVSVAAGNLATQLADTTTSPSLGDGMIGVKLNATGATARTQHLKNAEFISVTDFGADPTAVSDSLAAFNAAIAYVETVRNSGGGGVIFVPAGSYRLTGTLRLGGFVRLIGENYQNTTLFWDATHTSGHCIELGPDESGLYAFSGSYTFASRLENLDLSGYDVYRGLDKAMVYTVGAHQFSGLFNVSIRRFRSIGVHYDTGTGDPAMFIMHHVELQASTTPPTAGDAIGIKCSAGGAIIDISGLVCQGDAANPLIWGILMEKDHLNIENAHFEECTVGIALTQNETLKMQNRIASVTGHNTVPELVYVATTNNVDYTLLNVANTTVIAMSLTLLHDYKTGLTLSATYGTQLPFYSSGANRLERCATVKVTTAQVLALNGTPQTIIAAPGAGFSIVPSKVAIYKPSGVAYAGVAAGEDLVLKYTNGSGAECSAQIETTGFLDQATAETRWAGIPSAAVEPVDNAVVVLHLLSGEITTGDSDLYVRVWYDIIQTTFTV